MDQVAPLDTADAVIDALGGTSETARLTGASVQSVTNWRSRLRIPPEYFLTISQALTQPVDPAVFSMKAPEAAE